MKNEIKAVRPKDMRSDERVKMRMAGKLFVPAEESTQDCIVINLSAGGAGVQCSEPPPLDTFVVLYIEGFGRFDGVTTRYVKGVLGLKIICKDAKRKRLEQDLAAYVAGGMEGVAHLHRDRQGDTTEITSFTAADGTEIACKLLDISLQGATLQTRVRPTVGDSVLLGRTRGWVVGQHEKGVVVEFQHPEGDDGR